MTDPLSGALVAGIWTLVSGAVCSSKLLQKQVDKAHSNAVHLLSDNFPKNHVAARAALAAAIRALKDLAKRELTSADVLVSRGYLAEAAAFEKRLHAWAARWNEVSEETLDAQFSLSLKASVESSLLTATSQEAGEERLRNLRRQAVSSVRAMLIAELDAPQSFLDRFDGIGEGPGFFAGFAAYVAHELRHNTEFATIFQAEVLIDVRAQLETAVAEARAFETRRAADQARLEGLIRNLQARAESVFFEPRISEKTLQYSAFRQFYFASEHDDFSGRSREISLLWKHFLSRGPGSPQFQWTAICGGAGSGKSRLALHLKKISSDHWPVGGFVRRAFIENVETHLTSLDVFPEATLFILDYADLSPRRCIRLIERCAALARSATHPVRVLVLLRREDDPFFSLVENDSDGADALDSFVDFRGLHPNCTQFGALRLEGLEETYTLKLMRSRMEWVAASDDGKNRSATSEKIDDAALLSLVRRYDQEVRPLYALIVADALQRGTISIADVSESQEEARLGLFWEILEREVNKRWKDAVRRLSASADRSAADLDRHISFLALSTLCRGIGDLRWQALETSPAAKAGVRALLPRSQTSGSDYGCPLNESVLSLLSGGERGAFTTDLYPTVQPDLLGEAFVLLLLDPRGKSVAEESRTWLNRQAHLLNLAWAADPQGTAFFCALVDQDYPMHAARHRWLLPDQLPGHASGAKMDLFSSLVRNTVTPLGRRAATTADLQRMTGIMSEFRPLDTDPSDAWLQYLEGVEHLAEHLSFIVNKSVAPRTASRLKLIHDPRLAVHATLTEAANREIGGLPEDGEPGFSQAIFRNPSDGQTVEAALVLLRELYDEALVVAFSDEPYEVRRAAAGIVAWAVTSLFWSDRHRKDKFGFAATPLSDEERAEFRMLGERCSELLSRADLDESSLAIVCIVLRIMMYAEQGQDRYRGRPVFEIIQRWAYEGKFGKCAETSQILNFLGNHAVNEMATELEKPKAERADLSPILAVADRMMGSVMRLDRIDDRTRDRIALSYADVVRRLMIYDDQVERSTAPHLQASFETYFGFRERFGAGVIGTHEVSLLSLMIATDELTDQDKLGIVLRFAPILSQGKFDRVGFNAQMWTDFAYDIFWLLRSPEAAAGELALISASMNSQIGARFTDELAGVIKNHYPQSDCSPAVFDAFCSIMMSPAAYAVSGADHRQIGLARTAQHLIGGNSDAILQEIEASWQSLGELATLSDRVALFDQLWLVLALEGLSVLEPTEWRLRILRLLDEDSPRRPDQGRAGADPGEQALIECAAMFAALEIRAGGSASDWLYV